MQPTPLVSRRRAIGAVLVASAMLSVPGPAQGEVRAADTTISATLADYSITLSSSTVPPGQVSINATVAPGGSEHDLVLRNGPGTPELNPGESALLDLGVLPAGSYTLFCDLPGHEELGMHTTLTVGEGGPTEPVPEVPSYVGLSPARVLDTRTGIGVAAGRVGAGGQVDVQVAGVGAVPADAGAVVVNVTSTDASASSFVTVWPSGSARPEASNVNTQPGVDTPNLVVVKVGTGGRIALFNNAGTGHLVADVLGWFPA